MADEVTTRKLATIVALDVAGYSARTEADEARTAAEVAALRPVIEAIAARHGASLRWLSLFRDRSFQAIFDEGLALAAGDAAST